MDDKDWRIIKTIAEERNLTRAAARLYMTQPALTYRLKNLEDDFGTQLVSRMPSGVMLTAQGECLLNYAREMLLRHDAIKERIRNMADKVQGPLRLGSSGVFAHFALPGILKGFLETYPEVEISLKTALSQPIVRMLEKQEVTVAIVRGEHAWEGERLLLMQEPLCLVSRARIGLDALPQHPHIRYGTDAPLQRLLDEWWRRSYAVPPRTTMEVNTMDTAREMVLNGLGWTLLPSIGLTQREGLYVEPVHWPDGGAFVRDTWVLCSAGAMELRTVRVFIDYLRAWQQYGGGGRVAGGGTVPSAPARGRGRRGQPLMDGR